MAPLAQKSQDPRGGQVGPQGLGFYKAGMGFSLVIRFSRHLVVAMPQLLKYMLLHVIKIYVVKLDMAGCWYCINLYQKLVG